MVEANRNNTPINNPGFGSVANPIAVMMGRNMKMKVNDLKELVELSNNYTPPKLVQHFTK